MNDPNVVPVIQEAHSALLVANDFGRRSRLRPPAATEVAQNYSCDVQRS